MAAIALTGIGKVFAPGQAVLRDVDLSVNDGERVVLVGPSGSGKSTLLRIIAGLEQPTVGTVLIDGRDVTGVPPERRDLAMVFQSYALYPHKSVRENLAFGLRVRHVPPGEIARRVDTVARTLGLEQLLAERAEERIGSVVEVLVDSDVDDGLDDGGLDVEGRADHQAPEVDGTTLLRGCAAKAGSIVRARVVDVDGIDLVAVPA